MSSPQQAYNFCPHCGRPVNQDQKPGQKLWCRWCGKDMAAASTVASSVSAGTVHTAKQLVDRSDDPIKQGKAARCRFCGQVVETRGSGEARTFVPHYNPSKGKKICISSGRRIED